MAALQLSEARWMEQLRPLLTAGMRSAVSVLMPDQKTNYDTVKDTILEAFGIQQGRLGDRFWKGTKPRGVSFATIRPKWLRLLKRYVGEDEALDAVVTEKIIQSLPQAAAVCTFVTSNQTHHQKQQC